MPTEQEDKTQASPMDEPPAESNDHGETRRGRTIARATPRLPITATNRTGTGESSTLRGRTRWRSTSPFVQLSRNTSSQAGVKATPRGTSPSSRLLLRVAMMNRQRSQSPSRSRDQHPKQRRSTRRRKRTRGISRDHVAEATRHQKSSPLQMEEEC